MGTVLPVMGFRGDTDLLKGCYDKAGRHIVEIAPARPVIQLAVPRGDGLMVCDVWESEDALRVFEQNSKIRDVMAASGMAEPTRRVFEIHTLGWPVSAMPTHR